MKNFCFISLTEFYVWTRYGVSICNLWKQKGAAAGLHRKKAMKKQASEDEKRDSCRT